MNGTLSLKYLVACTAFQMQRPSISNAITIIFDSIGILFVSLFVCPSISLSSTWQHACVCTEISCPASSMQRNRITQTATTKSDWWRRWCKPLTATPANCESIRSDARNHAACQSWTKTYRNNIDSLIDLVGAWVNKKVGWSWAKRLLTVF